MTRPTIAISTGDPAGVGPELSLQVAEEVKDRCVPILLGDARVLRAVAERLALPLPSIVDANNANSLERWEQLGPAPTIVDIPNVGLDQFQPGTVNPATGQASYDYVTGAIDAFMSHGAVTANTLMARLETGSG